ncbi:ATP-dependent nuclease [Brevibacterium luteolum]|uniref:ATP-dependent nuclease n=1 Tax=Brevibacterium luteolum TaxID=199591 RepID=UPI0021AF3FE0|nr:AAA family ATPase [Brevibacterium luteolum]MCT1655810.1 AAA family ATPase [Brevibacterium luteolum]
MKLTKFRIENYRGIREAHAQDLADYPLIALTGRNGTGKSLILEALAVAWAAEVNLPEYVGPYANSLSVEIGIELSEREYSLLETWLDETGQDPIERSSEHILEAIATSTHESGQYAQTDAVITALQNPYFTRRFAFGNIDLLSARRQPNLGLDIGVDLSLLDASENAQTRRENIQDEVRWKQPQYMPDIGSYLASLDYREYVARRDEGEVASEYERLQAIFERATGKKISRPTFDSHTVRPEIHVKLPSGKQHSLVELSNGEREMIGMFYYITQLSSRGGVLLLDEPESHLHPSLQTAVIEAISTLASQGQAIIVTHSPSIIGSMPTSQICSVRGAWELDGNQVKWAHDDTDGFEPLNEIGISATDLLQMSALLVVEGADDAKRLNMMFPEELARVRIIEAGSREQVINAARTLNRVSIGVPHICVIDRDFSTPEDVANLEREGIFVWNARAMENILLNPALVAESCNIKVSEARSMIASCTTQLLDDAIKTFTVNRVCSLPLAQEPQSDEGLQNHLEHQVATWNHRLQMRETIAGEVADEIQRDARNHSTHYVDGKKLMGAVHGAIRRFRTKDLFAESLVTTARRNPEIRPSELNRLINLVNAVVNNDSQTGTARIESVDARVQQKLPGAVFVPRLNRADNEENDIC